MGNQQSQADLPAEMPGVAYKDSLGAGRLFKTALCVLDEGGLVAVKAFIKRGDSQAAVRQHKEQLLEMRDRMLTAKCLHILPYQRVVESERAVFLVRQYAFASLAERLTTRPFLTCLEKVWIAWQLLVALHECHALGICHGDIKPENVLVTSWNWAYLADFAPYKPTLLPSDNPAGFSLFFDTAGRRRCYLAPERVCDPVDAFPGALGSMQPLGNGQLQPAMDVFSLGCVLAELFMDGQQLFDYSKLLAYRQGTHSMASALEGIQQVAMRQLIECMTLREPQRRPSASECLQDLGKKLFPPDFLEVLHPLFSSLSLEHDDDSRVALVEAHCHAIKPQLFGQAAGIGNPPPLPSTEHYAAPHAQRVGTPELPRAAAILAGTEGTLRGLEGVSSSLQSGPSYRVRMAESRAGMPAVGSLDGSGQGPQLGWQPSCQDGVAAPHVNTAPLLVPLLCTLLRGATLQRNKCRIILMLRDAACHCDDTTRLGRILPYLVMAAADALAAVRVAALRGLSQLLQQVHTLGASGAGMVVDYVLPALSLLPSEAELSVQVEYARHISILASVGRSFVGRLCTTPGPGGLTLGTVASSQAAIAPPFEAEVLALRLAVERVVHDMLVSPAPEPRLAVLRNLGSLIQFVGRQDAADVLLPSLLTLHNCRQWQVRAAFFEVFRDICCSLGPDGAAAIALPFLDRMVADTDDAVATEALCFVAALCELRLLRKRHILAAASKVVCRKLLLARAAALRAAAVRFFVAAAAALGPADVEAQLLPLLPPLLSTNTCMLQTEARMAAKLPSAHMLPTAPLSMEGHRRTTAPPTGHAPEAGGSHGELPPVMATPYSVQLDGWHAPGDSLLTAALDRSGPAGAQRMGGERKQSVAATPHLSAHQASNSGDAVQQLLACATRALLPIVPHDVSRSMAADLDVPNSSGHGLPTGDKEEAPAGSRGGMQEAMGSALSGVHGSAIPQAQPWRPRGMLVAHLAEHRRAVNRLAVSPNGAFVVSASSDETARIWDCRRLERDIAFRSRLVYTAQAGKITSAACLPDGVSVATGSSAGTLHVWRVEHAGRASGASDRYTGIVAINKATSASGSLLDVAAWGHSLLVYTAQRAGLVGWDLRAARDAWHLPVPPSQGVVHRFALDPAAHSWLVTGSTRGELALWDARFLLPVMRWRHPTSAPVSALAPAAAPARQLGDPARAPLIFVAAGDGEVALWDAGSACCKQVFRAAFAGSTSNPGACPGAMEGRAAPPATMDLMGRARQLRVGELQEPTHWKYGFRAVLPTAGGQLLIGGADQAVRCWDVVRPERSYMICCPPAGAPRRTATTTAGTPSSWTVDMPRYEYTQRSMAGVPVVDETRVVEGVLSSGTRFAHERYLQALAWSDRAAALCHRDPVMDLARVDLPHVPGAVAEPVLLTCSRDGVVRAWR